MLLSVLALVVSLLGISLAQRPRGTSICDYYTEALLKENNATNQYKLLTLIVNTAVIGNYTQPNKNAVPGILNPNATFNGTSVNLVPYFNGGKVSTNVNGSAASVNFLDDGGAAPLKENKPANGTNSKQYNLLTHLYSYFGGALNCSQYGKSGFPEYNGGGSQYNVHKFMHLDNNEVNYFIQQVGLSAQSFGVTQDDIEAVGNILHTTFATRCSPQTTVIPAQGPQLQSICVSDDCPLASNATCDAYGSIPPDPSNASSQGSGGGSAYSWMGGISTLALIVSSILFTYVYVV